TTTAALLERHTSPTHRASDRDPGGEALTFTLDNNANGAFQISSGGLVSVADATKIDPGNYTITIRVAETDDATSFTTKDVVLSEIGAALAFTSLATGGCVEWY